MTMIQVKSFYLYGQLRALTVRRCANPIHFPLWRLHPWLTHGASCSRLLFFDIFSIGSSTHTHAHKERMQVMYVSDPFHSVQLFIVLSFGSRRVNINAHIVVFHRLLQNIIIIYLRNIRGFKAQNIPECQMNEA